MAQRCGYQRYLRYEEGRVAPPGFRQARGSAVHSVIATNLARKRETGVTATEEELRDLAASKYDRLLEENAYRVTSEDIEIGVAKVQGDEKDRTIRSAVCHGREIAPRVNPLLVEAQIETTDPVVGDKRLLGILDLVDENTVVDTKTSGRANGQRFADLTQQGTVYVMLEGIRRPGVPLPNFRVDTLVTTKTKTYVEQCASRRTQDDLELLLRTFGELDKLIRAGVALPTDPTNWWCSETWCGFAKSCPYYKNRG